MDNEKVSIPIFCNSETANQLAGDFTLTIPNGITIPRDQGYKLYLHNLALWNTSPNIYPPSASNGFSGTNTLSVTCKPNGGGNYNPIIVNIALPTGGYSVQNICNYVNQQLANNGINTTGTTANNNPATNYIYLSVFLETGTIINLNSGANNTTSITFSKGLANILGFTQKLTYTVVDADVNRQIIGASAADITSISTYNVHISNIINETMSFTNIGAENLNNGGYIYSNTFTTPSGSLQSETIENPIGIPLNPGIINQIRIKIVDQFGNILHFNQNGNFKNNGSTVNLVIKNY